jgi:hypothetical protein
MLVYVKHLVSILVFLFLSLVIGNYLMKRVFTTSIRSTIEGMETGISSSFTDADKPATTGTATTGTATTGTATTVPTIAALTEPCEIKDVDKPIELAAAFEKVNKQSDMIRTLNEMTEPATPLKIDKSGDAEFLVLSNLKLLVNNGISKNEASLKAVYDQYIGNREVMLLVTDINSLKMEKANADILHKQEIALICRSKVIIDGHQTLIDRILEKGSD